MKHANTSGGPYAGVVVEAPVEGIFHYLIPETLRDAIHPGSRVKVPFGRRTIRGVCVELSDTSPYPENKMKNVLEASPEDERIPEELLELTRWVASYYQSTWGTVLAAAIPVAVRKGTQAKTQLYLSLGQARERTLLEIETFRKRAPRQAEAMEDLLRLFDADPETECFPLTELLGSLGISREIVKGLEKRGLVSLSALPVHGELKTIAEKQKTITLTDAQRAVLAPILAAQDKRCFAPFLLYGITGSGKTEIYLQALQHTLAQGRTVLVLVPEISLTPQTVERFRQRAGEVAVLHSNMADGERANEWRRLRSGEVRVVVGARSAVFAPLPDLGLIIVDEEHERTFKQENDPRYHARDVAVVRARNAGAAIILGSATPSLESWHNAREGKYALLQLRERVGNASPPSTAIVNLQDEWTEQKRRVILSRQLEHELTACLRRKEQAILFLNRRGFHTYIHCKACGHVLSCETCDIPLTYHKEKEELRCHYCDFAMARPQVCPACSRAHLFFSGTGTERVEDVLARILPEARLLRMDSDTMTGRDAHAIALSAFSRGEYDILLGTQMIAKGFDFPNVTLVGVLSADASINMPDFRAAERTFQLITQVVGRSGRADKPGRAVIQAFTPQHHAVQTALRQDFEAFAEQELHDRKGLRYPPYGRLARLLATGEKEPEVQHVLAEAAKALQQLAPRPMMLLGPAPCPFPRLQAQYRYHLLIKGTDQLEIARLLHTAKNSLEGTNQVRIVVDIDPMSLL